MDWNLSGALSSWDGGLSPAVLRLLPYVHYPPARVHVLSGSTNEQQEAVFQALDARGYWVESGPLESAGACTLICEQGQFSMLAPDKRADYVEAAARCLEPGGQLFGVFLVSDAPGALSVSEILHRFGPFFDATQLSVSSFAAPPGQTLIEAILTRRAA
jgi:hypothetical protein